MGLVDLPFSNGRLHEIKSKINIIIIKCLCFDLLVLNVHSKRLKYLHI